MTRSSKLFLGIATLALLSIPSDHSSSASDLRNAEPLPAPPPVAGPPVVGAPAAAPPACPCTPCITYCDKTCCFSCPDCSTPPPIKTVLKVANPQDCECCTVDVPVCLPGCCTGEPCVKARCGVFGRGIVRYEFACGFRVTVTFRARGDILVTYWNV